MAAVAEIYQRHHLSAADRAGGSSFPGAEFKLLSASRTGRHRTPPAQQIVERLATDAPALYEIENRRDLNPQAGERIFYRFLGFSLQ